MIFAVIGIGIACVFIIGYIVFFRIQYLKSKAKMLAMLANLSTKISEYDKKIADLDEKIGGEDWKEMVKSETEYAKALAHNIQNLIDYNGEEQTEQEVNR